MTPGEGQHAYVMSGQELEGPSRASPRFFQLLQHTVLQDVGHKWGTMPGDPVPTVLSMVCIWFGQTIIQSRLDDLALI
jgi:hypothetical protein